MKTTLLLTVVALLGGVCTLPANPPKAPSFPPTEADVAYGPGPKQKMDLYLPEGDGPFPVIVWYHGGGWFAGNKVEGIAGFNLDFWVKKAHVAVVSAGYRLTQDARADKVTPPIVAIVGDNLRAIQFLRHNAAKWKLDPNRILVGGGSAGAVSALCVGCMKDQANPASTDPVERMSTKVCGIAPGNAQSTIDPKTMQEWNPGLEWGWWAFETDFPVPPGKNKVAAKQFLDNREKWMPYLDKYSPDHCLSKETPPIYFFMGPIPPENCDMMARVHSALNALGFQKLARERGAKCYVQYAGGPDSGYPGGNTQFMLDCLGVKLPK